MRALPSARPLPAALHQPGAPRHRWVKAGGPCSSGGWVRSSKCRAPHQPSAACPPASLAARRIWLRPCAWHLAACLHHAALSLARLAPCGLRRCCRGADEGELCTRGGGAEHGPVWAACVRRSPDGQGVSCPALPCQLTVCKSSSKTGSPAHGPCPPILGRDTIVGGLRPPTAALAGLAAAWPWLACALCLACPHRIARPCLPLAAAALSNSCRCLLTCREGLEQPGRGYGRWNKWGHWFRRMHIR